MSRFLIAHDRNGYVASSLEQGAEGKIDIALLQKELREAGNEVEIICIHDIKFPSKYRGWYVIYPSSEDYGLFYKDFLEDILLRLQMDGAILLPRFELFRAHHNKVFMELCRMGLSERYRTLQARCLYSIKDVEDVLERENGYPMVLKIAAGAGSEGVALIRDKKDAVYKIRKMGAITYFNYEYSLKKCIRQMLGRLKRRLLKRKIGETSQARQKLVLQTFLPGLTHDYKVLVFADKYYLLRREVRTGDFRASGSGKREFPDKFTQTEEMILEFAKGAYEELHTPMLSIDIAWDGRQCHMIEFQCLNFGPYTLQFSDCYYKKTSGSWAKISGRSVLEKEMANSYMRFAAAER